MHMYEVTCLRYVNTESQSHIMGNAMVPGKCRCLATHTHTCTEVTGFFTMPISISWELSPSVVGSVSDDIRLIVTDREEKGAVSTMSQCSVVT